jgi:hypothetical protein
MGTPQPRRPAVAYQPIEFNLGAYVPAPNAANLISATLLPGEAHAPPDPRNGERPAGLDGSHARAARLNERASTPPTIHPLPPRWLESTSRGPISAGPYPTYSQARIASAVTTYLVYLSVVGALGTICWLSTIWAVKAGKGWARAAATALFVLGTSIALTDLLIRDTSGDTGLPPLLGWVGMLPCLAGLFAVTLLWRKS